MSIKGGNITMDVSADLTETAYSGHIGVCWAQSILDIGMTLGTWRLECCFTYNDDSRKRVQIPGFYMRVREFHHHILLLILKKLRQR